MNDMKFGTEFTFVPKTMMVDRIIEFHDVEFLDIELTDDTEYTGQLYIRGINVGCVVVTKHPVEWSTAYAPEGVTGGAMEDVSAETAEELAEKIAKQWHLSD